MIITVKEVPRESGRWGDGGHWTGTRVFTVSTDTGRTSQLEVMAHDDIPKRYSWHPDVPGALCLDVSPQRRTPGNRLWEVTCNYTTDWLHDVANPLLRPLEISWRDFENLVPTLTDLDGEPFVSTTGELLEDVFIEAPGEIANVAMNLPGMPTWYGPSRNAINAGPCRIDGIQFSAGLCRIKSRQITGWQRENDVDFRRVTLEIHIRPQGWKREYLNRGFYQLETEEESNGEGGTTVKKVLKRIIIDGRPSVEPQLLDVEGKLISFRDENGDPVPGANAKVQAAIRRFRVRNEIDFNELGLQ